MKFSPQLESNPLKERSFWFFHLVQIFATGPSYFLASATPFVESNLEEKQGEANVRAFTACQQYTSKT